MEFSKAYAPRTRVQLKCEDASRAKQSMKKECDINNIVAKYQKTGMIDFLNRRPAQYADCTGVEFREAMIKTIEAREAFDELPSKVRLSFNNDPAEWLDYVGDPAKDAEEVKDELVKRAEVEEEPKAPAEPAPAEPAPPA